MKRKGRYWILLAVLSGLWLGSCTQDYLEGGGGSGDPLPPGTVTLSVRIPELAPGPEALAAPRIDSRTIDPQHLHLLLFRSEGGDWVYDGKYFGPDDITQAGSPTVSGGSTLVRFRFRLPPGESAEGKTYRAMLLANTGNTGGHISSVEDDVVPAIAVKLAEGRSIAYVRSLFEGSINSMLKGTHIPMWGETQVSFTADHTSAGQVRMLRSLARIDVGLNFRRQEDGSYDLNDMVADGLSDFAIQSIRPCYIQIMAQLVPEEEHLGPDGNVTAPSLADHTDYMPTDPYVADDPRYFPLYACEVQNSGRSEKAYCIIVGGSYKGGPTTYYKIEFYDRTGASGGTPANGEGQVKPTAENRFDILRNHVYVVNIVRVSGPGYGNWEQALNSEPVNIEVTVDVADELEGMEHIATDGQYVLSVSDAVADALFADRFWTAVELFTDYDAEGYAGWELDTEAEGWAQVEALEQAGRLAFRLNGTELPASSLRGRAGRADRLEIYYNPDDPSSGFPAVEIPVRAGRVRSAFTVRRAVAMNKPRRNMLAAQRFLSPGQHELRFDLSASSYDRARVRVACRYVNTEYGSEGVTVGAVEYLPDAQGVELTQDQTQFAVPVPANAEKNWLRSLSFEYLTYDKDGGEVWMADRSPTILQDGAPLDGGYLTTFRNLASLPDAEAVQISNYSRTYELDHTDALGVRWWYATWLNKPELVKIDFAETALSEAKSLGRCDPALTIDKWGEYADSLSGQLNYMQYEGIVLQHVPTGQTYTFDQQILANISFAQRISPPTVGDIWTRMTHDNGITRATQLSELSLSGVSFSAPSSSYGQFKIHYPEQTVKFLILEDFELTCTIPAMETFPPNGLDRSWTYDQVKIISLGRITNYHSAIWPWANGIWATFTQRPGVREPSAEGTAEALYDEM